MPAGSASGIERGDSSRGDGVHRAVHIALFRSVHTEAETRHRRIRVQEAREAEDNLFVLATD